MVRCRRAVSGLLLHGTEAEGSMRKVKCVSVTPSSSDITFARHRCQAPNGQIYRGSPGEFKYKMLLCTTSDGE
jgi:hypothetical protein